MKVNRSDIVIKRLMDDDPDLSYLGEFVSKPPSNGAYIDRMKNIILWPDNRLVNGLRAAHLDDCGYDSRQMRYYVSCNYAQLGDMRNWKHCSNKTRAEVCAKFGSLRNADIAYTYQDLRRLLDFGNGWYSIGIQAELTFYLNGVRQHITSGGLWGIESDSGSAYFEEVQAEQVKELYKALRALGFTVVNDGEPQVKESY